MAPEDEEGEREAESGAFPGTAPGSRAESAVRAGRMARGSLRDIAVELFGAERVAAEWHPDGAMRARVRRLARRAATAGRKARE